MVHEIQKLRCQSQHYGPDQQVPHTAPFGIGTCQHGRNQLLTVSCETNLEAYNVTSSFSWRVLINHVVSDHNFITDGLRKIKSEKKKKQMIQDKKYSNNHCIKYEPKIAVGAY